MTSSIVASTPETLDGLLPGRTGANPFAFLVGCPRSGTTLLQRMLAMHPMLALLPEADWLATAPADPSAVDAEGFVQPALLQRLIDRRGLGRYARLPVPPEEVTALLAADRRIRYDEFAGWLLDRHGAAQGRPLVVNKTVGNALHVEALARTWPAARIVHLIRDGRDVALSANAWRRAPRLAETFSTWAEEPVATAALWWEWHVRRAREAGRQLGPDRYREVRYEELVRWPEATLVSLCAFLGIPYEPAMLRFHEGRERDAPDLDAKHAWRPVTVGLRDWRTQLPPADQARFEAVAGDLLDELGYPRAGVDVAADTVAAAARARAGFEGRPLPARWGDCRERRDTGGTVLWLTGLPCAGKSTVAEGVAAGLRARGRPVEVLDGDVVRTNLSAGLGFSRADRDANIARIAFVAHLLARHGVVAIVAAVSPYRAARRAARALDPDRFVEVWVRAGVGTCADRDVKGMYARALRGEIDHFTGVSDPYEEPEWPALVLDTEAETPAGSVARVLALLDGRGVT